ncbi:MULTISPECIES: UDP-N-acetylmuramate dehydrogenase [Gordonibacter]|uniref:UDP-N-acetylenolpyruvoylglucosamine reductase n=1 Tax=Gordonibacter faecis TaxID=3047475 RepID=A0ABT7DI98_9ACTN|nr:MULTISPECIES: UDP-N-acetylmuramate dehydrogenase [unclassified Gordonibacter]MDJ1649253.1 UDP-N-acetylmuramate dehydrogenase [Gordonibacter sp. KGMB12511]HIW75280.1 UDP-N-acetylmuramate dehydrogenase [Candidatus Gordonibacter avicola]
MDAQALVLELKKIAGEDAVRSDEPMAAHTTFQIGGPADVFVEPRTEQAVCATFMLCRQADVPVRVLGLGSDLLVADAGLRCVVVRLAENFATIERQGNVLQVQAGASNADVAQVACAAGLAGYEFASGIPGTIGGAAIMNAGAYGGEFKDVAVALRCLTPTGEVVDVSAEEAAWSYRHSMMDAAGYVVLAATLRLTSDNPAVIQERMDDLARRRAEKQPLDMPSAGSTFKRPEGHFVGKLVQEAGLRGVRVGGAQVSEKHTGFLVNAGDATAADVCALIELVQERVYEHTGVQLEPEVRRWGFEDEER